LDDDDDDDDDDGTDSGTSKKERSKSTVSDLLGSPNFSSVHERSVLFISFAVGRATGWWQDYKKTHVGSCASNSDWLSFSGSLALVNFEIDPHHITFSFDFAAHPFCLLRPFKTAA
jgi:hypothetical protein